MPKFRNANTKKKKSKEKESTIEIEDSMEFQESPIKPKVENDESSKEDEKFDDSSDEEESGSEDEGDKISFEFVSKEESDDSSSGSDSSSDDSDSDSSDSDSSKEDDEMEIEDKSEENTARKYKIKLQVAKDEEEGPIVISFKNGIPQSLNDEEDEISFEYRKVTTSNRISSHNSAVIAKDDTCQYKGYYFKNDKRDNTLESCNKRLVGVLDKATNTVKLYLSSQNGYVYPMEQSILHKRKYTHDEIDLADDTESDNENHTTTFASYNDRQRLLINSFGSAKKQKLLKTKEANKLDPNAVIGYGDTMQSAFEKQQMSASNVNAMLKVMDNQSTDEVAEAAKESLKQFLPSYNESATSPSEVYEPHLIAGDRLWSLLTKHTSYKLKSNNVNNSTLDKEWIQAFLTPIEKSTKHIDSKKALSAWPASMIELINNIHNNPASKSNQHIISSILLLVDFVKLHRYIYRSTLKGSKKADRFKENVVLISKKLRLVHATSVFRFLELFSSDAGILQTSTPIVTPADDTPEHQNRVFTKINTKTRFIYMLILYVYCSSQSNMKVSNIKPFLDEIELSAKDAAIFLRMAGFHVNIGHNDVVSVTLRVPLTLNPSVRRRRATYG